MSVRLRWGTPRRSGCPGVLGPLCTLAHSRGLGTALSKTRPRTSVEDMSCPPRHGGAVGWGRGGVLLVMRPPGPGMSSPNTRPRASAGHALPLSRWSCGGGAPGLGRPDLGTSSPKTHPPSPSGGAAGEDEGRPACVRRPWTWDARKLIRHFRTDVLSLYSSVLVSCLSVAKKCVCGVLCVRVCVFVRVCVCVCVCAVEGTHHTSHYRGSHVSTACSNKSMQSWGAQERHQHLHLQPVTEPVLHKARDSPY